MQTKSRLLGLAFASADALIEIAGDGTVVFCAGAGPDAGTPLTSWQGSRLDAILGAASRAEINRVLADLPPGVRSPAVSILLPCADGRVRRATLRAFRLPNLAPATSCALTWEGEPFLLELPEAPPLSTPAQFLDRARDILEAGTHDHPLDLAFVDLPGLAEAPSPAGERMEATLQAASLEGRSAARLTPERFALLRGDTSVDLSALLREAAAADGVTIEPRIAHVSLNPGGAPINALRALRFTIESCLREGGMIDPERAFGDHLKQTLRDADRFSETVRSRDFELHWQPIVDLTTGVVHHFEGLARFGTSGGPAPIIRMAEELGLVEAFDLAVAEKAVGRLRRPGGGTLAVAVNVSALSLSSDAYVNSLLRMTQVDPALRQRLMVEVTETAALADLEAADKRLSWLRAAGIRVCIDDFGAGAASFDWLGSLKVDMVKVDGAFVKRLETDPRASTLIAHLAALCASLKIDVVAEMIETEETASMLRDLGVRFGQGWYFGRAEAEPVLRRQEPRIRRVGAVEAWG